MKNPYLVKYITNQNKRNLLPYGYSKKEEESAVKFIRTIVPESFEVIKDDKNKEKNYNNI